MPKPHAPEAEPRAAVGLEDLLALLVKDGRLAPDRASDVAARARTLASQVVKEKVGSVRSQAAARTEVSPAEIIVAARVPNAADPRRTLDEDAIAECLARAADVPYLKIDPLKVDGALVTKTLSRPFARRHVVVPVAERGEALVFAITDPFDAALRESLETLIRRPLEYVVAAKRDVLAIIDRVYGFRSSVSRAASQLADGGAPAALAPFVQLRSNEELAGQSDEDVIAAVDYLLNYAFDQRASDIHLDP